MGTWEGPKQAYDIVHRCLLLFGRGGDMRGVVEQRLRDVLGFQIGDLRTQNPEVANRRLVLR